MSDNLDRSRREQTVPMWAELEQRMHAKVVTFEDGNETRPGGMCNCCGGGPNPEPDWRADPWSIYQAGLCDGDGVYYSMLCEGCLEDIRHENEKRAKAGLLTERDDQAREVTDLLGNDIDGAQGMMDDLQDCPVSPLFACLKHSTRCSETLLSATRNRSRKTKRGRP